MEKRNRPIGIFDSGIGGLTVVREIIKEFPHEDIVYFGDTARLPYGNKSPQTVIKFSLENARFLLKFGVKFIIVACNTSSSLALATLRRRFSVPFLGVISPAVRKAVRISPKGRIGIIGTRATVGSSCYQREIKRIKPGFKSFTQACPLFVPLAEEGWVSDEVTLHVARRYLTPLLKKDIDTLILGCTHYPLLKKVIRKVSGRKIEFVDSAKEVAAQAKKILTRNRLCATRALSLRKCRFYVSDEPAVFKKVGKKFLGKTIQSVQKVNEAKTYRAKRI
ncbi:MAG: glutamate racemase [Candidatus Omnitrophica bacterium]|nr:glutamate racemase [Candidatus Omnitrophota bacterium]